MDTIKKILILSANPKDTARLRLGEEVREIEEGLRRSKHREQFVIQSKWAVRLRDLRRAMLDGDPQIVHFCGHGEEDGLMVEDDNGNAILIHSDALSGLFELFTNQVECVLLNACYSATQAKAINKHINYVIGMSQGITDRAAVEFAVGFYDALGAGKSFEGAFKFGRNAIQLYDIPESLAPTLLTKDVKVTDNQNVEQDYFQEKDAEQVERKTHLVSCFAYDNFWVGRENLVTELCTKIQEGYRVLILTGITGIGKTTLGEKLAIELQDNWTNFDRVNFDDKEKPTDFASVATELIRHCGKNVTSYDSQQLLHLLVQLLRENQYLFLIDSLEEILKGNEQDGWSDFKDDWWIKFFQNLLSAESCQSCVILTSQDLPAQLSTISSRYPNYFYCQPLEGLSEEEQLALFKKTGVEFSPESQEINYIRRIGSVYEGHPLALRVIAGEIRNKPFNGNILAYWNKYSHEIEDVEKTIEEAKTGITVSSDDQWQLDRYTRELRRKVKSRLEQTFNRLDRDLHYAYVLLCEASIYRYPVPESFWLKHLEDWGLPENWNEEKSQQMLDALKDRYLVEEVVENNQCLLRLHNLIRSIALERSKLLDEDEE